MFNKVRASLHTARTKVFNSLSSPMAETGPLSFFSQWFNPNNLVGELQQLEKYTGIVYACVSAIAEDVAKIKFVLYRTRADGTQEPVTKHPFLELLKNPNPSQSDYEFMEMTQTHIELTGEAFWYIPKGAVTGKPKELWLMRPDLVQVVWDMESGEITGYVYHKWNGRVQIPLDLDEVIHFKMPNPINPYRGMGTVQAGIVYIQTEEYASRFSRNYLANNATPAGIVNFKGTIGDAEFQKVKRQWTRDYGGVESAGKTAFVRSADVSYQKIGSTLQDIDLKELKNLTRDDIMFMFRVSKPILGITEDVNYSNAQTAEYIFAKRVIDPKMARLCNIIQTFYNKKYKDGLTVGYLTPIPTNTDEKIAYYTAGVNKWLTPNEIREAEGMDGTPGGDVLRMPNNYVPIDQEEDNSTTDAEAATTPVDDTTGAADIDESEADDDESSDPSKKNDEEDDSGTSAPTDSNGKKKGIKTIKRLVFKKEATSEEVPQVSESTLKKDSEAFRQELMGKALAYTEQLESAIKEAIGKQRSTVLTQIKYWKRKDLNPDDVNYDSEQTAKDIQNKLEPILKELMVDAGTIGLSMAGSDQTYTLTELSWERIQQRVEKVAADYSQQTKDALASVIKDGVDAGLPIAQIKKNIENVFSAAQGYRAERLARTEAIHEANYATLDAYKQTGYVVYKEWYAGGPDPCQFCEAMNGTIVQTDEVFIPKGGTIEGVDGGLYLADYQNIEAGDLHPNCMCTILPSAVKE